MRAKVPRPTYSVSRLLPNALALTALGLSVVAVQVSSLIARDARCGGFDPILKNITSAESAWTTQWKAGVTEGANHEDGAGRAASTAHCRSARRSSAQNRAQPRGCLEATDIRYFTTT